MGHFDGRCGPEAQATNPPEVRSRGFYTEIPVITERNRAADGMAIGFRAPVFL